jgi:hypothetical protein
MTARIPDASADRDLRYLLETLDPKARDTFGRVLIHDHADVTDP